MNQSRSRARSTSINSGTGCEIDQVFGQSWALAVGLGRVLPEKETRAALKASWRYNFTPEVGQSLDSHNTGRWYAIQCEGGHLMCSFPRADWDYKKGERQGPRVGRRIFQRVHELLRASGRVAHDRRGDDYRGACHREHGARPISRVAPQPLGMKWSGAITTRARWRATASSPPRAGSSITVPRGEIAFAPRIGAENFRVPFTSAEGWGTFSQKADGAGLQAEILPKWGKAGGSAHHFSLRAVAKCSTCKPRP